MAKILITTIQVNLHCLLQGFGTTVDSPELLLNFLPLTYHHSHFLAATFDSHLFSPWPFWGRTLFLQLGCFGLDITSFCIASHKAGHKLALALPFNFFFFTAAKEAIVCIAFCLIKYLCI